MTSPRPKVLLADDDRAMLRLIAKWLETAGYPVLRAADGEGATKLILSESPAILITDWEMPRMNGVELCRWVREQQLPHYLYTVFLTVRSDLTDMLSGLEAGADDFLKKPVDRDELLARMRAGARVMELERKLSELANTDALTGLPIRRTLRECLEREWARSCRHGAPLSCVMLDIDYFKRINDTHGHPAGDEVIRQVGGLLAENIRTSDMAGRYGGEEFCIVLPETTEAQATLWAERVRRTIATLRIPCGETTINMTCSFGVAQRMADTTSSDQLVDQADQALIVAKRSGRDRVVPYRSLTQASLLQSDANDPAELLRGVPVHNVMSSIVAPLNENDTVASASNYFLRLRIHAAPVVNSQGLLVGMVSEKDIMAVMLGQNWWAKRIKDVMKQNVVCYEDNTPALAIYEFLTRVTLSGVVIVNQGRPVGLITRSCLLRFFMNTLAVRRAESGSFADIDAAEVELLNRVRSVQPKDRLGQVVRHLAREATDLEVRLEGDPENLVPCVVGGASRLQEMLNDLLALSRFANDAVDETANKGSDGCSQAPVAQGLAAAIAALQAGETAEAGSPASPRA
jgi:diguanylate cyclase (GGDEF)-like protein